MNPNLALKVYLCMLKYIKNTKLFIDGNWISEVKIDDEDCTHGRQIVISDYFIWLAKFENG